MVLALVTARVARALGPADLGSGSALPSPPPLGSYASPWFRDALTPTASSPDSIFSWGRLVC